MLTLLTLATLSCLVPFVQLHSGRRSGFRVEFLTFALPAKMLVTAAHAHRADTRPTCHAAMRCEPGALPAVHGGATTRTESWPGTVSDGHYQ